MAFTEAERNQISKALKIIPIELQNWINFHSANITVQVETDVRTELSRWTVSGGKFVRLSATESNKGVNTDSGDTKDDIRENIAILLGMDMSQFGSSIRYLQRA
jgi:hypothetical protein